jgi:hypothetical protein
MGRIVIACYRPKSEKRDALLWVLDVFGIRVAGEPHFRLRTVRYLAAAIVVALSATWGMREWLAAQGTVTSWARPA